MSYILSLYSGMDAKEMTEKLESQQKISVISLHSVVLDPTVMAALSRLLLDSEVETVEFCECSAYCGNEFIEMAKALGRARHVRFKTTTILTVGFLSQLLQNAQRMTSLTIQEELSEAQLASLSKGMSSNTTLTSLDLSRAKLDAMQVVAEGLRNNTSLRILSLRGVGLNDDNSKAILHAIKAHPGLQELDLSFNHFHELENIGQCLQDSKIQKLSVGYQNVWGPAKVKLGAFTRLLQNNVFLERLSLARNKLDNSDAIRIATLLATTRKLKYLDLGDNNISDNGIESMANAMANSASLSSIRLVRNPFRKEGSEALIRSLHINHCLEAIEVNDNAYAGEEIRYLSAFNKAGRKLMHASPPIALWPLVLERVGMAKSGAGRPHHNVDIIHSFLHGPLLFEGLLC